MPHAVGQPIPPAAAARPSLTFAGLPQRLDIWLSRQRQDLSRARIQQLIRDGHIRVNQAAHKPHYQLKPGDEVRIEIPEAAPVALQPENIPLAVLYEDADLIVINKAPGLVTHPAPGNEAGTLVNALLYHCRDLAGIGGELRPGIVHRLDRDTSGALVAAKNDLAVHRLISQFKRREVHKYYLALVWGAPRPESGTIETLVGRSPHNRKKMSAEPEVGRPAVTHYKVLQALGPVSLLGVRIETGRTHQIRVHLAHIGHPVVGDRQYGRARADPLPAPASRQMLHAETLSFNHPRSGLELEFHAPMPDDMRRLIQALAERKKADAAGL